MEKPKTQSKYPYVIVPYPDLFQGQINKAFWFKLRLYKLQPQYL